MFKHWRYFTFSGIRDSSLYRAREESEMFMLPECKKHCPVVYLIFHWGLILKTSLDLKEPGKNNVIQAITWCPTRKKMDSFHLVWDISQQTDVFTFLWRYPPTNHCQDAAAAFDSGSHKTCRPQSPCFCWGWAFGCRTHSLWQILRELSSSKSLVLKGLYHLKQKLS